MGETTASLFEMHPMSNKTVLEAQSATEDQTATFSSSGPQTTTAQSTAKHAFSTPQESAILQPETAASMLGMHATSNKTVLDAQLVVEDQTVSASGKQHSIPFQEPTLHCPIQTSSPQSTANHASFVPIFDGSMAPIATMNQPNLRYSTEENALKCKRNS